MTRAASSGGLLVLLVLLAALVVAEWHYDIGARPGGGGPSQSLAPVAENPTPRFALPDRESFSETLSRPLFMPNREPSATASIEPPPAAPRAQSPNVNRYAVSAIVIVDNERIALLADATTGRLIRVREGELVAGWRVERIDASSAVLINGDTREELSLRSFEAPPPVSELVRRRGPTGSAASGRVRDDEAVPARNRPRQPKRAAGRN